MRLDLHTVTVFSVVEFSGVAAGALAGALEARRNRTYHYDLIGVLGLAVITALGGGISLAAPQLSAALLRPSAWLAVKI
jgi:uncharacterized membrane protein YeiH